MSNEPKTVDEAINECSSYIDDQRKSLRGFYSIILLIVIASSTMIAISIFFENSLISKTAAATAFFALCSVALGVCVAIFRMHHQEIARVEHYKLGFHRIRVAGNNGKDAFNTDVRRALTQGAFSGAPGNESTKGKIQSPIPGHPASDISTALLNKLVDGLDLVVQPKARASAKAPRGVRGTGEDSRP